jgi:uncharacterized membrane protein
MRKINNANKICIILGLMSVSIDISIFAIQAVNPTIFVICTIFEIVLIAISIMYYFGNAGTESSKWPSRKT